MWFPSDIIKFKTLIKKEEDEFKRQGYISTYYWFLIPFFISLAAFFGIGLFAFLS